VDESTEPVAPLNVGGWSGGGTDPRLGWLGWREIQRAVRPVAVVLVGEDAERTFGVAPVHDQ